MAATAVDAGYLATHLGVPPENISSLVTTPTADLVNAVLAAVTIKAREYDSLYTAKVGLEVEFETRVRGAEAQRNASNESAKAARKEVDDLRQKLKDEETKRQALENELHSIKSSTSASQSEIETLRARIASLETSNRESLAIIDAKNKANEELLRDVEAQHRKNLDLNREITTLQQSVQNADNAANSAKMQQQRLKQEVEMGQRDCDFYQNELKTKTDEVLRLRREKGARIAELQRLNEDATSNLESLKRTEQQLRQRLDEAQKKADDALTKVQQLQEADARKDADHRQETDSLRRLNDLQAQQTLTHKNRVHEVENREEQIRREGDDRIRRISEELARANMDKEELSQSSESLQAEVGRLEAIIAGASTAQPGSAPQTPRALNGSVHRSGSPFATPGTMRKSMSTTQTLEEYYKIKGQLSQEKQRNQTLSKELDDIVDQLEAKGPEIEELHAENERLQEEIKNMSHLSDESFRERDNAKKAARKAESIATQSQAEIKILVQRVRELGAQVQLLAFNTQCREKGFGELTLEETYELQRLERPEIDPEEPSSINSMILQRLVVFKDIQELQEKNQELLKVIHDLGEKMESEEAIAAKNKAIEDHEERERLQKELTSFRDTLKSFEVKSESIRQERDIFRRIVESRASADEMASALGQSEQGGVLASIEATSTVNDDASDFPSLLRDLQQSFDIFRNEHFVEKQTTKEQLEKLSAERNSLQTEVSKVSSHLTLANERFEMLQSNFAASQNENKELQKRSQAIAESAAKQDLRIQQVAEDLVEAKGQVDSMRSENANLKAERDLWRNVQKRLSEDNESLLEEKGRLNSLLGTAQSLHNQSELANAEAKQRLQSHIDSLEAELNATKRKLADEVEEAKKTQLRKEFDAQQSQKRIDELTSNLSQIREELVHMRTTKDHLHEQVNQLTIELATAKERADRLQPRPTPRPGSMAAATDPDSTQLDTDERIQELIHEATDLKRDLEMTKSQLENAQAQAEQYKQLSQESEDELERLNSAQGQYAQEMEAMVSSKDATIKELQQRVEDLSAELARSNSELSSLRDSQAEIAHGFEEEKAILESEIKRLQGEEEKFRTTAQFHQQDLRTQAEIAASAQQSYENEVVKHGGTAKTLSALRDEHNVLKGQVSGLQQQAEKAEASLLHKEASWKERKQTFEREVSELRARRDDANAQNKLLHEQLENLAKQVSTLQENRASNGESLDAIAAQSGGSDADKYRELCNYLRSEKEILEVQYAMKDQECRRLQTQLKLAESQLDEARLRLDQERRAQDESSRNSLTHKDLMSKLEELNLFRESSATLRVEAREARAQLTQKTAKVNELESTIQPLHAKIEELRSQQSFKEAEMKQLQEDRDRWQKRTEEILSKHGRTDPAEIEELKQKVATLESERNALQEAETPLKEKIDELEKSIAQKEADWAIMKEKLIQSAKERARTLVGQRNQVTEEKKQLETDLTEVKAELSTTRDALEGSKKEKDGLEEYITKLKCEVDTLKEEAKDKSAAPPPDSASTQTVSELQSQLAQVQTELGNVTSQKASIEEELSNVKEQLSSAINERDLAAQSQSTNGNDPPVNGEKASEGMPPLVPLSDDERKALEDRIAAAEARAAEWESKARELEEAQDSVIKSRSDKMKETLNKRLHDFKAQMEQERTQMKQDREKLEADFRLRMEQERKIWEAEHAGIPAGTQPPATPQKVAPDTAAATPNTPLVPDLNGLNDKEIRDLVFNNSTIKSIVQNNIKKQLLLETKKLKDEQEAQMKIDWEPKLTQAREQATELAEKKATLKVNMTENRARAANAKLAVVETAAKETPQRPVGEVWEIAKNAKPPPPPAKPQAPATVPAAPLAVVAPVAQSSPPNVATAAQESRPPTASTLPKLAGAVASNTTVQGNPFAAAQMHAVPPNPFSQPAPQQPAPVAAQPAQPTPQSQIPKASGIPMAAATRKPSGPNQGGRGGPGRGGRGGRGGAQQARNSLNPSADNFQPGNKRPRGDSEIGNGAKRARGGAAQ